MDGTFGTHLRNIRSRKGLTQMAVARKSGIGQTTISAYENGTTEPTVSKLADLARALDVHIHELVAVLLVEEEQAA